MDGAARTSEVPATAEPLLRRGEWAARRLGVSRRTFYGMVATRAIPEHVILRLGRALYVRAIAFEAWAAGSDGQGPRATR